MVFLNTRSYEVQLWQPNLRTQVALEPKRNVTNKSYYKISHPQSTLKKWQCWQIFNAIALFICSKTLLQSMAVPLKTISEFFSCYCLSYTAYSLKNRKNIMPFSFWKLRSLSISKNEWYNGSLYSVSRYSLFAGMSYDLRCWNLALQFSFDISRYFHNILITLRQIIINYNIVANLNHINFGWKEQNR